MKVVIKKGKSFPSIAKHEGEAAEIRAVAIWQMYEKHHSKFIDSQEDLDSLPEICESISVMFSDGTYVELPLESFKGIFRIVPEGELTDAIYGNK